jgi:sulfur-carrier protein
MKIRIILYASLAHLLPPNSCGNSCIMDFEPESTVETLLEGLGIPSDSPKIVFLNGRHAEAGDILRDGDRIAVFPPIAGG